MLFKSLATPLFIHQPVQANNKESIKAPKPVMHKWPYQYETMSYLDAHVMSNGIKKYYFLPVELSDRKISFDFPHISFELKTNNAEFIDHNRRLVHVYVVNPVSNPQFHRKPSKRIWFDWWLNSSKIPLLQRYIGSRVYLGCDYLSMP